MAMANDSPDRDPVKGPSYYHEQWIKTHCSPEPYYCRKIKGVIHPAIPSPPAKASGWIYFIWYPEGDMVRIGTTIRHPDGRYYNHAMGSPVKIVRLGVMRGSQKWEWRIQSRFWEQKSHGEWFHLDERLRDFIDRWADPWPSTSPEPVPLRYSLVKRRGRHRRQSLWPANPPL